MLAGESRGRKDLYTRAASAGSRSEVARKKARDIDAKNKSHPHERARADGAAGACQYLFVVISARIWRK
jgi:hypothetical protein